MITELQSTRSPEQEAELAALRVACQRTQVAKIGPDGQAHYKPWLASNWLATKWIAQLEQNQMLASCCRHPENHEIGAFYSSADDEAKGVPDIYIFFCTCGRMHRKFCVGGSKGYKTDHLGQIEYDAEGKPVPHYAPRPKWLIDGK